MCDDVAVRDQLQTIVSNIATLDQREGDDQVDVLNWIASGAPLYRIAKPATPPKHLVAYSVLIDADRNSVLLVDHRDAQKWLPTGGHVDIDEDPALAASRELREELGIDAAFLPAVGPNPLMITQTKTEGISAGHIDVSLWYVFSGSEDTQMAPDEGEFSAVRWWPLDQISESKARFDPHFTRFRAKLHGSLV
jgi:ADP-ribose pyrophosphatase YjhB (NUDIX family)